LKYFYLIKMISKRIQLTLFVDAAESNAIEKIRSRFNPLQYELIKTHVTLCREDELEKIEKIIQRLTVLHYHYIKINFGAPIRFASGKGVLLPANDNKEDFQQLRKIILQGNPLKHEPHITLMHPRNATCTDIIFDEIKKIILPTEIVFKRISLIEQKNEGKWNILQEFELKKDR
jgi:2'-5' RNA ligase superfamily